VEQKQIKKGVSQQDLTRKKAREGEKNLEKLDQVLNYLKELNSVGKGERSGYQAGWK